MESISVSKPTPLNTKLTGLFVIICGSIVLAVNAFHADWDLWRQLSVLAVLLFISRIMPTRSFQGAEYSVAFIIDLVLITFYGTPVAVVLGGAVTFLAGLFSKLLGRKDSVFRILVVTGRVVLVIALASTLYRLGSDPVISFGLSSMVYFLTTTFFITFDSITATKESYSHRWVAVMRTYFINFFILSLLTYLLIYLMKDAVLEVQLFSILLFFIPALFVSHAFRLSMEIKQGYLNTVKTIARAIEAKDHYTKGHSERVAELTLAIAKELKFPEKDIKRLEFVALLHDAGKIGVPEEILNKSTSLTPDEFELVKKHSSLGAEILAKIKFLNTKSDIVLHHHEKYDGSGYPSGLFGEEIPLESRILAIADAYDAMTSDRPFRKAKTPAQALDEMQRLAGSQFDPKLVKIFSNILRRRGEI